ncbi:MAG: serine/threonine protein kinase [Myxococcales bacterium]|nr:serine/threonine protein kinase [Myxococcales bacterium]
MTTPTAGALLRDGRYVVTGLLGEGSQGATLEAVDKRDGRLVAIKRFEVKGARSWKEVELAEREARVLESLAHPALPAHIEHFEEGGALCLVMEKIEGQRLDDLHARGALDAAEVLRFLGQASEVLGYLHGRSPPIVHRDVKPGNFVRRPDGRYVLVDFGSVRDSLKPKGGSTVVGTFGYMAPEQLQGRALPVTDVYGLGATALALLTGVEPESLPHKGLSIDVAASLAGCAEPAFARALEAMLRPDPDERASDLPALCCVTGATS